MSISILIATYNRSEKLKNTLEAFCNLERTNLDVQIVVIDNGSLDDTRAVVDLYSEKLNIKYMFEPVSGKSNALNKAILEVELGDIVVFTDDDIIPARDWLEKVEEYSASNPEISVFGGRIYPHWCLAVPKWLEEFGKRFLSWAYAYHDLGDDICIYNSKTSPHEPFGPNFWLRKEVFKSGILFDRRIGPTNSISTRIMGEDTVFLRQLQAENYQILYCPEAIVNHVITAEQMTMKYLKERAKTSGMSRALESSFKLPGLYVKSKVIWLLLRYIFCVIGVIKRLPGVLHPVRSRRYLAIINLYKRIGYDLCYIRNSQEVYELSKPSNKRAKEQ